MVRPGRAKFSGCIWGQPQFRFRSQEVAEQLGAQPPKPAPALLKRDSQDTYLLCASVSLYVRWLWGGVRVLTCIKHVEECLTLGKCYITITRQKWCNQSTIILRTCNVSCIFRWCDGLFPADPSTLPTQHCVGSRMCIHGWWMRKDAVMTVAKTTDLDPSGSPDLDPLGTLWS